MKKEPNKNGGANGGIIVWLIVVVIQFLEKRVTVIRRGSPWRSPQGLAK
jgi:hypothetical protein